MRFGSGSVEAALAAFWLTQHDAADGQFVVDPAQPEWWEPMIVRAALERDENGLDQRSSDPWLQRAIRPTRNSEDQAPPLSAVGDGLALSLAMTLEAWVPGARTQASSPAVPLTEEAADAFRGALDAVGSAAYTAEERALFAEDFSRIERATQMDLTGHLASLACMAGVERLVRAQAATVLVTLPSPTAAEAIAVLLRDRDPVLRQALDLALPYASAEVYARLQEAVSSDDEFVRHRASELITRGGEAAEQVMSTSLVSPDPRIRAATARALGVLKPGDAREALVALLDDADLEVCVAAANALGRLGDPSVANDLASHLDSTDADLRVAIAMALGNVRAPTVVTALLVLLLDADVRVRLAAVAALGMIADERAARALRSRQHDKDPVVQAAVATALRRQTRF
jgi:HEAT repeat protein